MDALTTEMTKTTKAVKAANWMVADKGSEATSNMFHVGNKSENRDFEDKAVKPV